MAAPWGGIFEAKNTEEYAVMVISVSNCTDRYHNMAFFLARCDVLHPVPCQRNLPSLTV